jgi:hypothetical protein
VRANRDGTYDVEYEDGDKETGVAEELIRVPELGGGEAKSGGIIV